MTSRNMILMLFMRIFRKKTFKCGFMPIQKVFLLFLVIVFFSETSFQSLTNADISVKNSNHLGTYSLIIWNSTQLWSSCNGYFCQLSLNQGMKSEVVATVFHFSSFQNAKKSSIKVFLDSNIFYATRIMPILKMLSE